MSEDIPAYGDAAMKTYVFRCPHCCGGPNTLDHADLQPVPRQLLGTDWQWSDCRGWALVRVLMPDRELTIEKGLSMQGRRAQEDPALRRLRVLQRLQDRAWRLGRDSDAIDKKVRRAEQAIKRLRRDMWRPIWGPFALPESGWGREG